MLTEEDRTREPDDLDHVAPGTVLVFRVRGVERVLALRRAGFTTALPPTVLVCGPLRFRQEIEDATRELILAGCLVFAPDLIVDAVTVEQRRRLDELRLRAVELADHVLVVDPDGRGDESVGRQIEHAREHCKPVSWLSDLTPGTDRTDALDQS